MSSTTSSTTSRSSVSPVTGHWRRSATRSRRSKRWRASRSRSRCGSNCSLQPFNIDADELADQIGQIYAHPRSRRDHLPLHVRPLHPRRRMRTTCSVLAAGGIVRRPTMALIGEAGPEAVVPLNQMPGASPPSLAAWAAPRTSRSTCRPGRTVTTSSGRCRTTRDGVARRRCRSGRRGTDAADHDVGRQDRQVREQHAHHGRSRATDPRALHRPAMRSPGQLGTAQRAHHARQLRRRTYTWRVRNLPSVDWLTSGIFLDATVDSATRRCSTASSPTSG